MRRELKVKTIKTGKIVAGDKLFEIFDQFLPVIRDGSILAVTSKIISICEERICKVEDEAMKEEAVKKEADLYLDEKNPYGFYLTINEGILIPNAGIDESNGNGNLILWPKNPWKSAKEIRNYLASRFKIKNVGVIITDSKTTPLRWGTTGIALAFAGFAGLRDYIGQPDIFGRKLQSTKANIADGLAAAAVVEMGEGAEQTPLALITGMQNFNFISSSPSINEIRSFQIAVGDDLYGPLLEKGNWQK